MERSYRTGINSGKSDTVDYADGPASALLVCGAGDVSIATDRGNILFVGITAGTVIPIRHKRTNLTGSSATNLIAMYR